MSRRKNILKKAAITTNQTFPKILIFVILVILIAGGISAWRYFGTLPEIEIKAPEGNVIEEPLPDEEASEGEIADVEFLRKSSLLSRFQNFKFSPPKTAIVIVENASYYGPPFDSELYQLNRLEDEFCQSNPRDQDCDYLFAKSRMVELEKYLNKKIQINYKSVKGVIIGEQQFVIVDQVVKEIVRD